MKNTTNNLPFPKNTLFYMYTHQICRITVLSTYVYVHVTLALTGCNKKCRITSSQAECSTHYYTIQIFSLPFLPWD